MPPPRVQVQGSAREGGPGGTIITAQKMKDVSPVYTFVRVTTDYQVGRLKRFVLVDATQGAVSIALPQTPQNLPVTVKKIDLTGNVVTVRPTGSGTIDGAYSYAITISNFTAQFVPWEDNWYVG